MSAINTGGNLIHYEVLGRGRPVILVHGWVGSWRYWIPTMQLLQNKYRVYALDLYGFGDSAKDPTHYSLEHQIALVDDFMRELGIPKAALMGHGLGALIAAEYARRYADRIPRLLLADAPLFDPGDLEHRVPVARKLLQPRLTLPLLDEDPDADAPTVMSASAAMRAAMIEAARARGLPKELETIAEPAASNHNPLLPLMDSPDALLAKCFRRSETNYEKLSVDLAKIDPAVLKNSVDSFELRSDAGYAAAAEHPDSGGSRQRRPADPAAERGHPQLHHARQGTSAAADSAAQRPPLSDAGR